MHDLSSWSWLAAGIREGILVPPVLLSDALHESVALSPNESGECHLQFWIGDNRRRDVSAGVGSDDQYGRSS
jgi:hypothetical protein